MLIRIYETLWLLIAIAAFITYITGNFGFTTGVVFGFICIGLIFMGMIGVLPFSASHPSHPKH